MYSIIRKCKGIICLTYGIIFENERIKNLGKWFIDGGDEKLVDYNLSRRSIVVEVGGYTGVFTEKIWKKFRCNIVVYEPVEKFYLVLKEKFVDNKKIKLNNYGLGNREQKMPIVVDHDGSSTEKNNNKKTEVILIKDVCEELIQLKKIDLMSVNIEGGEYKLIEKLLENERLLKKIENLQIQFHIIDNTSYKKYLKIKDRLLRHFQINFEYQWVWISFKK